MTNVITPQDEDTLKAWIGPHEKRLWWWYDASQPAANADLYVITNQQIVAVRRGLTGRVSTYGPFGAFPISGLRVYRDGELGRIQLEQKRAFFKWTYWHHYSHGRPELHGLINAPEVARLISKTFGVRIRRSDFPLTANFPERPTANAPFPNQSN